LLSVDSSLSTAAATSGSTARPLVTCVCRHTHRGQRQQVHAAAHAAWRDCSTSRTHLDVVANVVLCVTQHAPDEELVEGRVSNQRGLRWEQHQQGCWLGKAAETTSGQTQDTHTHSSSSSKHARTCAPKLARCAAWALKGSALAARMAVSPRPPARGTERARVNTQP
jgi:hypothetical protein